MNEHASNPGSGDDPDPTLLVCIREAKIILVFWLVQSAVMVGLFLLLGYNRTTDPFGLPFGLPSWYLFGGIIPALVFLVAVIYVVRRHFQEVDLK